MRIMFQDDWWFGTVRTMETVDPTWEQIESAILALRGRKDGTLQIVLADETRVSVDQGGLWEHVCADEPKVAVGLVEGVGYYVTAELREPQTISSYIIVDPEGGKESSNWLGDAGLTTDNTVPIAVDVTTALRIAQHFLDTGQLWPGVTWYEEFSPTRYNSGSDADAATQKA